MTDLLPTATILVIAGPTASGKSAAALELATALNGTIINADALQVYDGIPVLSAAPTAGEMAAVPHRLYGALPPEEACSAGRWRALAIEAISAVLAEGRVPMLVGGTGLYLRALIEGIVEIPPVPAEVRTGAEGLLAGLGGAAFRQRLGELDPEAAGRLHDNDRQRLIRAFEIVTATGRTQGDWQREMHQRPPGGWCFDIGLLLPERDWLYERCDRRFGAMLAAGAEEEVRALLERGLDPDLPAMKAVGVPELAAYLRGEASRQEAAARAQQATRNYAKRQLTWLRNQMKPGPGRRIFCAQDAASLSATFRRLATGNGA
ncbi:tRNA (adenosine(37)-N6)-dimethylallyltransferase MiaA [Radicibacter daui]|uniref:tRNA (adenosine(37)-N6)-dimethylallyltransferase MiaA n=1 Tax=Radicibacter daui TaxID=3064829 RepID=UPI004046C594